MININRNNNNEIIEIITTLSFMDLQHPTILLHNSSIIIKIKERVKLINKMVERLDL